MPRSSGPRSAGRALRIPRGTPVRFDVVLACDDGVLAHLQGALPPPGRTSRKKSPERAVSRRYDHRRTRGSSMPRNAVVLAVGFLLLGSFLAAQGPPPTGARPAPAAPALGAPKPFPYEFVLPAAVGRRAQGAPGRPREGDQGRRRRRRLGREAEHLEPPLLARSQRLLPDRHRHRLLRDDADREGRQGRGRQALPARRRTRCYDALERSPGDGGRRRQGDERHRRDRRRQGRELRDLSRRRSRRSPSPESRCSWTPMPPSGARASRSSSASPPRAGTRGFATS